MSIFCINKNRKIANAVIINKVSKINNVIRNTSDTSNLNSNNKHKFLNSTLLDVIKGI